MSIYGPIKRRRIRRAADDVVAAVQLFAAQLEALAAATEARENEGCHPPPKS